MNPAAEIRKPLRARKTMVLSSRKQVELLGRMKALQAGEGPAGEEPRPAEAKGPCPGAQEGLCSGEAAPAPAKEPVASLVVNSEISIYKDPQEGLRELPSPDVKQFLNAGALQDILWHWYEKESGSPLPRPVDVSLQPGAGEQWPAASSTQDIAAADGVGETPGGQTLPVMPQEERHFWGPKTEGAPAVPLDGRGLLQETAWQGSDWPSPSPDEDRPSVRPGDPPRKRAASRGQAEALSKRSKASGEPAESRLGKVKCLIRNQLEASVRELDQGLRDLNERIDRTQCLRKHEGIAIKIVKKISRLDRHINAVISFQRAGSSKKPRAHSHSKTLNGTPLPLNTASGKPAAPRRPTATEIPSSTAKRSPAAAAADVDVVSCVEAPKPSLGLPSPRAPAPPPKAAAGQSDAPAEQNVLVIDLTDEESNPEKGERKEAAGSRHLAHESRPETLPQQPPSQMPLRFPHLPPLPSVECDPALPTDPQDTLPPQRLELVVAQVNQPKGIALQWNISQVDPRCAPIESFSLFIYLEDAGSGTTPEWRRTSVIKALPLPMACSLSQFPRSARCYFTMRSRDIHGRYGPFCEVQSISAL